MTFRKYKKIHLIGIAGIGMSAIAEILIKHKFEVSGSDLNLSEVTDRLNMLGAKIHQGHSPENLGQAEVVVYSSAVKPDNPELVAARQRKLPVIRRAEMLAELMRMKFGLAVAGTHGKTTTTSMIGSILVSAGLDPTVVVGGISPLFGSNARIGSSQFLVAEADEFDRSFLKLTPTIAVITSLELEHLDCYRDMEDLKNAFTVFANSVPFYGTVILCLDEPAIKEIIPHIERSVLTYGLDPQSDISAVEIKCQENRSNFKLLVAGETIGEVELSVPGQHNVKNALAAIAAARELDIGFEDIVRGFNDFTGVKRRFELLCYCQDIMVIDDYAHHFTEIKATLNAAKTGYGRRIIALFQPHLYSRTRDFYHQFGSAFQQADEVFVVPIYPAREEPLPGITAELIVQAAREAGHRNAYYIQDKSKIADAVLQKVQPGDMIVVMGAGDIWKEGIKICQEIKSKVYEA